MLVGKRFNYSNDDKRLLDIRDYYRYHNDEVFNFNPEEVKGVEAIGAYFFAGFKNLRKVNIPKTITKIGNYVFQGCENLKKVDFLHEDIERIGAGAFSDCTGLKSFTVPPKIRKIERGVFYNCTSLEDIYLHDKIGIIEPFAFENTNIKAIHLPESIRSIGYSIFRGSPLEYINLPKAVSVLPSFAFEHTKFKQFVIPDTIIEVQHNVFYGCEQLEKLYITEGATLKHIGFSENQRTVIYASAKSSAFKIAEKENIQLVEIPSSKQIELICEKDNAKLLAFLLNKYSVEEWFFDELLIKPATKANAKKCLEFLKQWKMDKFC